MRATLLVLFVPLVAEAQLRPCPPGGNFAPDASFSARVQQAAFYDPEGKRLRM